MDLVEFCLLSKEDLLKEISGLGVMSDFEPAKRAIESYPGEEVLIAVDKEQKYGEMFLVCYTEETKASYLAEIKEREAAIEAQRQAELEAEEARKAAEHARLNAVYEDKPIMPRKWESDTTAETESEMNVLSVQRCREPIVIEIQRPKRLIHQKHNFLDREASFGGVQEFRAYKDPHNVAIKQKDLGIQAAPFHKDGAAQTTWYRPANKAIQCTSTGTETEDLSGKEDLFSSLERAVLKVEQALQQNETLDISNDTFNVPREEMMDGAQAENELRELKNFADPTYSKSKLLSAIDWRPKSQGMVAVSAVENLSFDQRAIIAGQTSVAYVLLWDFRYLVTPTVLMQCPHEVLTFRFSQTNPHVIAGGTISGQVVLWDTEEYMRLKSKKAGEDEKGGIDDDQNDQPCLPKFISNVDYSHKRPVADLFWLPPSTQINYRGQVVADEHLDGGSHQFVTVAGDGQVLVWDTRFNQIANDELRHIGRSKHVPQEKASSKEGGAFRTLWAPIFRAHLKRLEGVGELSICRAAYCSSPPSGETHYSVGGFGEEKVQKLDIRSHILLTTEEGDIMAADISGGKGDSSGKDEEKDDENAESKEYVRWLVSDHSRPCTCMQISPFFPNIILTVGDWKFHIWKIGEDKPLFVSPLSSSHLTGGAWSPTRPAVLIVACADGSMLAWDFTDSSYRPSIELKATHSRITSLEFLTGNASNARQQLLAVGDESGTLHICEMPRNLSRPLQKEENMMSKFLDRELTRMRYVREITSTVSGGENKESGGLVPSTPKVVAPPVAEVKQDVEHTVEAQSLSQEDVAKEEESFAKLEAEFIAELGLLSTELPGYAKNLGVDLAPEENKGRK